MWSQDRVTGVMDRSVLEQVWRYNQVRVWKAAYLGTSVVPRGPSGQGARWATMTEQAEKIERSLEIEQLNERLQELERRVVALESRGEMPVSASVETLPVGMPRETAAVNSKEKEKRKGSTSVVPVLGKAVLAIAGAYLLRAVAESGAAPRWIMLVAGIAYAAFWLVWAVRSHRSSHFASVIFGLTAATILPPLLWEGTVRYQALTAGFTAAVLVGMVVLSLGLAWKESLEAIPWIGTVAAVGTAVALIVATHELRALTVALLAMALVMEVAACFGRWLGLRLVTALAADFAVGVLGMLMTSAGGVPGSYRAMSGGEVNAFCVSLMLIYGGAVGVRAFVLGKRLTIGEVAQAGVAYALGTWISLRATQGGSAGVLGVVFLLLAVVCYWGALKRFAGLDGASRSPAGKEAGANLAKDRPLHQTSADLRWNRRVSANYAAGLVLAGSLLLLSGNFQVLALSIFAVAAVGVFTRTKYLSLGIHGTFYLLAAGMGCGLFGYMAKAMAGTVPGKPEWSAWAVAVAAVVTYAVGSRMSEERWRARVLWVVPAAVVGSAVAALAVAGIAGLGGGELSASRLSMVRTVVTCVMALGLAYAGSRWNRSELGWVAYGAIGLGALKLVAEDLRFGNASTLMVSLLFYGLILILLPRVTRFGRVEV